MKVIPLNGEINTNSSAEQYVSVNTPQGWFLGSVVAGFILFVLAFVSNSWYVLSTEWSGLWVVCRYTSGFIGASSMEATHTCMAIGVLFYCASYFIYLFYLLCDPQCVGPKFVLVLFLLGNLITIGFTVTALVLFGLAVKSNIAYSFVMECVAAFLSLCAIILSIIKLGQEA